MSSDDSKATKTVAEGAKFYDNDLVLRSYDFLTQQANPQISKDIEFYINVANRFASKGDTILELGVGTGRVSIALANAGFSVLGIDASDGMLNVFKGKLSEEKHADAAKNIDLVLADITKLELRDNDGGAMSKFPLAMMPFSLLCHMTTQEAQRAAFVAVRRHLRGGAHLVLDVFDAVLDACVPGASSPNPDRKAVDPKTRDIYKRYSVERTNTPLTQSFKEKFRIERWDPEGETLLEHVESTHHFRWLTRGEMKLLIEVTGFSVVAEYSDFEESEPEYAKRQVWILKAVDRKSVV